MKFNKTHLVFCLALSALSAFGDFTVASYNIRRAGDKGDNAWELRLPRIREVIKRHGFGIVGFQEAYPSQIEDLKRELKGWESFGRGRSKDHTDEGTPIFWDAGKFELKEQGEFWLSGTPEAPGSNDWGGAFPRICTWVRLQDRTTKKEFYHFNTHLDYKSINARKRSAELILKKIAALPKGVPVVVTGDFNDEIGSEKYRAEVKKKDFTVLTPPGPDHPLTQMKTRLADAREKTKTPPKGTVWSDNGYGMKHVKRIDYIFVSPEFKVMTYETYADRPDGKYPSDHEPVATTLSF